MILDRVGFIYRLTPDPSDADNEFFQPALGPFKVNVQPESAEYAASQGDTFGRSFRAFTTQSGIHIGDKLTLSGTTTLSGTAYTVMGVADWNAPFLPHVELRLREAGQ